jgi:hypothetical protein
VSATTSNAYRDFAAGTFLPGSYEWQARTYGPTLVGAWSVTATFIAQDPPPPSGGNPDPPVITVPANDAVVGALQVVEWSAPEQESYQLRTVAETSASGELCLNPTAEVNADFWESNASFGAYASATITRSNVQAHGGSWSIRADYPNNPGQWSVVNSSNPGFLVGGLYRLSGWVFVPAGSPPVRPNVIFWAHGEQVTQTDQWVYSELDFVAISTLHFFGWETTQNPGTNQRVYVDDVHVQLLSVAADPSTVYTDTGEVVSTVRSTTAQFPVSGRHEHVQVRVKVGSNWSDWDSARVNVVHTLPPEPAVYLIAQHEKGALDVVISNPAPGEGEPAVVRNEVWIDDGQGLTRQAAAQPPNSTFRHWTPVATRDYDEHVRVLGVAADGTSVWALPVGAQFTESVSDAAGIDDGSGSTFTHTLTVDEQYVLKDTRTIA